MGTPGSVIVRSYVVWLIFAWAATALAVVVGLYVWRTTGLRSPSSRRTFFIAVCAVALAMWVGFRIGFKIGSVVHAQMAERVQALTGFTRRTDEGLFWPTKSTCGAHWSGWAVSKPGLSIEDRAPLESWLMKAEQLAHQLETEGYEVRRAVPIHPLQIIHSTITTAFNENEAFIIRFTAGAADVSASAVPCTIDAVRGSAPQDSEYPVTEYTVDAICSLGDAPANSCNQWLRRSTAMRRPAR